MIASPGFAYLAVTAAVALAVVALFMAGWLARRERRQRRHQRLIEAVVENSPAVIYVKDLAGRYLMVNQRYIDIFRLERAQVIGKTDFDLFPNDVAAAFRAMDERVAVTETALTEEETAPLDDGLHTYVSVKTPLRDEAGLSYAVFGISTDITEQRRAEEALHASERRNRLIVETALDAIVTIDHSGRITEWSPQAEAIFGWPPADALGRLVDETIMPERYRAAHKVGLERYLATGEAKVLNERIELTALRRDGQEFPIELSITPIHEGDVVSFCAFVRDITERKAVELRQRVLLDELNHRVKNSLASVQSIALLSRVTSPTLDQYYESLDGRLVALARAHDLLTQGSWEGASLAEIVEGTLAPYDDPGQTGTRGIDGIAITLSPNAALTLHMAFHELATNAAKYGALSRTGGRVDVHWHETDVDGVPVIRLFWRETGGPEVSPTEHRGFGLRMVQQGVERELEGKLDLSFDSAGLCCAMSLPVSAKVMPA
jgi:PAS domain S-box-containing protein